MTTKSQVTAGSQFYLLNPLVSPHVALLVPQLKGATGIGGGARKKIDASNFDSGAYDELQGGRAAPPELSGELVLDLTNTGHQQLKALFEAAAAGTIGTLQAYLGQSDDSDAPTVVTGNLQPAQTASPKHWKRSGFLGNGYLSDITPNAADNDIWRATFKFQWTGAVKWSVKGDIISKTY